jgi:hypothetical protein
MSPEDHFTQLRLIAASADLDHDQVKDLLAIAADLFEERRRIRAALAGLGPSFGQVRDHLNHLQCCVHDTGLVHARHACIGPD